MAHRLDSAARSGARARLLAAGLALTAGLLLGAVGPASGGGGPTCCVCSGCALPPVEQCFDSPAQGCTAQCDAIPCFSGGSVAGTCSSTPGCAQFLAPAGAPALHASGLAVAALVLTAFGLRGLHRRR